MIRTCLIRIRLHMYNSGTSYGLGISFATDDAEPSHHFAVTSLQPVWFFFFSTPSPTRIVHFFVCEQGSHNARRCFNALSVWGRLLFVRCCQWAMWEGPQPYQGLGIIDVGMVSPGNIKLSWTGSSNWNYRIYGATDIVNPNWIPVVDSIVNNGEGNPVTRTLNIASAPQTAFLRVGTLPELAVSWVAP